VVIPSVAVQRGPNGLFTWVVKTDNTVEPRPIKPATASDNTTVILSGVNDGERVVTDGQYKLQTNAPVNIVNPRAVSAQGNPS
jgi:multidrug efflux system membrane fusion protein